MTSTITIQKAVPEDALEIGEVFYKTWLATYPNKEAGVTEGDIEFVFKDRKSGDGSKFANLPENTVYFTAKENDHVVGVCRLIKHEDKNELKAIYVLPEYQGRGVGKMFWNKALKFFDSRKDTIVNVVVYNTNAIEFYKKLGFKDTGKRLLDERFRMQSGAIPPEMEMMIPSGSTA
jgi:ribosomal protein S18 acetylase RimI-like enzyme